MTILEKSESARNSFELYLLVAFMVIWCGVVSWMIYVVFAWTIHAPMIELALTMLFIASAIYGFILIVQVLWETVHSLIRNDELGSYVDLGKRELVYWHGAPPARRFVIALDRITTIRVNDSEDRDASVDLVDSGGKVQTLPAKHLRDTASVWAQEVAAQFPNIAIVRL